MALAVKNLPANAGDVRDVGLIPGSERSPGGRHGVLLQYSCLENPMDRGAWWAIIHMVPKTWTCLKRLSSNSMLNNGINFHHWKLGLFLIQKFSFIYKKMRISGHQDFYLPVTCWAGQQFSPLVGCVTPVCPKSPLPNLLIYGSCLTPHLNFGLPDIGHPIFSSLVPHFRGHWDSQNLCKSLWQVLWWQVGL